MLEKIEYIKAFVFDCDGVMTDGTVQMTDDNTALRSFNIKDGYAVQLAVKQGYPIAIISGGNHKGITHRFESLGVKDVFLAQSHKEEAFKTFCAKYNLKPEEIIYVGDDMPDIPLLKLCGIPCCPKDAASDVKEVSHFISSKKGGKGCVREIIEMVLKAQNRWLGDNLHHF
jgi:3-deoxy-D-manno-octulosonate 8-phosphate phosphatase (KDO 8-P phosphatase)